MTIKELQAKMKGLVSDSINKELYDKLGKEVSNMVKARTRAGYGVAKNNQNEQVLKPLSPKYVEKRKRGKLSSETTASTSNLTKTGSMLDKIKYAASNSEVIIYLEGIKNNVKAKYGKKDRPFMNLSKNEYQEIVKIAEEKIKNDINKKGL